MSFDTCCRRPLRGHRFESLGHAPSGRERCSVPGPAYHPGVGVVRFRQFGVVLLLLASCQGRTELSPAEVAPSSPSVEPRIVTRAELIGSVGECANGYAHPNVCCHLGVCTERPNAPFAACELDSLTFPDRGLCCSLDQAGDCVAASAPNGGADAGRPRCSLPCSPGGSPAGSKDRRQCSNQADPSCVYCCEGSSCTGNRCSCPPGPLCPANAQPGTCPVQPPCTCNTPTCDACPAGWTDVAPQFDLCCRTSTAGSQECFSQALSVNLPSEGGSIYSSPNGCEIYNSMGGHTYDLACNAKMTPQCTCSFDGAPTTSFSATSISCSLTLCGFPAWPR
jgi:hypothetical protein